MRDHFNSLVQSIARLDEVLLEPKNNIVRDAAIKRFELTFELSWKSVQELLKDKLSAYI